MGISVPYIWSGYNSLVKVAQDTLPFFPLLKQHFNPGIQCF